jgi:pantothenate kinase type III
LLAVPVRESCTPQSRAEQSRLEKRSVEQSKERQTLDEMSAGAEAGTADVLGGVYAEVKELYDKKASRE